MSLQARFGAVQDRRGAQEDAQDAKEEGHVLSGGTDWAGGDGDCGE